VEVKTHRFKQFSILNFQFSISMKIKGYIYAILSAAAYGTNPIFAKPLYNDGMNPDSVLLFRYIFAVIVIALMML